MTRKHSTRLSQAHDEPEDDGQHTASLDYPELGSILTDRPDPGSQITVIGSRTAAAYGTEDDPRNGEYNGGEMNDTGMDWAEPASQDWVEQNIGPQQEAPPPAYDPDTFAGSVMARLRMLEEADRLMGGPGVFRTATTINGTQVDDAGDAPEHGTIPRAEDPDSYDDRSDEGGGDPKWNQALPWGDKDKENAATTGMYPEGISAGGGPGISVGPVVAAHRVPWTGQERTKLHSWQESPPSVTEGDFVPSGEFLGKDAPPKSEVDLREELAGHDPALQATAAKGDEYEGHLHAQHGWGEAEVNRARARGDRLDDMHAALHDAGMAGHDHPAGRHFIEAPMKYEFGDEARGGAYNPANPVRSVTDNRRPRPPVDPDQYRQTDPARFIRMMNALNVHVRIDGKPVATGQDHDDEGNSLDSGAPDAADARRDSQPDKPLDKNDPEIPSPQLDDPDSLDNPADIPPAGKSGNAGYGTSPLDPDTPPAKPADTSDWPSAGAEVNERDRAYTQGGADGKVTRGIPAPGPFSPDDADSGGGGDQDQGTDPNSGGGDNDTPFSKDAALSMFTTAAANRDFRFEFTATWNDVMAKAKRIRAEGHVRIVHASLGFVVGEVRGDHDTYESGIQRPVGKKQTIQHWACGCPWASFHQDRHAGGRYAGRPCSHVMALQFEAQSRGMFGRAIQSDGTPGWAPDTVVVKSYPPYEGDPHAGQWRDQWRAPVAARQGMVHRATPDEARDWDWTPEERDEWDHSAGAPGQDCLYRHGGACPPVSDGAERTAAGKHQRPDGWHSEIAENPSHAPGGLMHWSNAATHVLHGHVNGSRVGSIHFSVSDDGKAYHVNMMHGNHEVPGTASSLMDDMYEHVKQRGAWLNHGERTPEGNGWWSQYSEPHPEVNTHHSPPHAGWGNYWHPDEVQGDADDNYIRSGGAGAHSGPHWERGTPWPKNTTQYEDEWTRANGLTMGRREGAIVPAQVVGALLVRAGEDPAEVGALQLLAGFRATADQANAPWGSNNTVSHPPQKPYGATSPPNKDQDPGSYGPLAGPDPENWGGIQEDSVFQMPLSNTAAVSYSHFAEDGRHVFDAHDDGSNVGYATADEHPGGVHLDELYVHPDHRGQGIGRRLLENAVSHFPGSDVSLKPDPYEKDGTPTRATADDLRGFYQSAGFEGDSSGQMRRRGGHQVLAPGAPHPEPGDLHWPDMHDWQQEDQGTFGFTDHSGTAGPSTAMSPRDPNGIRMEEALGELHDEPEPALPSTTGDDDPDRRYHYHVSPSHTRDSIQEHGLDKTRGTTPRVYLSDEAGSKLRGGDGYDTWKVDTTGIPLRDDKIDGEGSWYSQRSIRPDRISLHHPGATAAADGTIGGDSAGTGEGQGAALDTAALGEFGAAVRRALAGDPMGDQGIADGLSGGAQSGATVGTEPGMGAADEPLMPDDQSIQTIGGQQWSGGGADSDEGAVPAGEPQGDMGDIVAAFQRSAAAGQFAGGVSAHGNDDIAGAAREYLAKTAEVLPQAEADELIREGAGSRARNLGLLRLEGTHYEDEEEQMAHRGLSMDDFHDDVIFT